MKLAECKRRFRRQYEEIEKQKDLDIGDLKKRHEDLLQQKRRQDEQNFDAMQQMEAKHLAAVEEIQADYDKKLHA